VMMKRKCPDNADCSACAVVLSKNPRCRHRHFSFYEAQTPVPEEK
jgi:hypothetical protein